MTYWPTTQTAVKGWCEKEINWDKNIKTSNFADYIPPFCWDVQHGPFQRHTSRWCTNSASRQWREEWGRACQGSAGRGRSWSHCSPCQRGCPGTAGCYGGPLCGLRRQRHWETGDWRIIEKLEDGIKWRKSVEVYNVETGGRWKCRAGRKCKMLSVTILGRNGECDSIR